ncbi:hypothetical protein ACTWP5_04650 [Streptomyces sp. 4N509B]|uniref:hypothetical protein n=1 Tax=Streptomyces sp. 4N509B TaxID=3457413 RepID=UPI003FD206D2
MHEARHSEERGWYVVDPWGHMVHVHQPNGELRAAFFEEDREAAEALAERLDEHPEA